MEDKCYSSLIGALWWLRKSQVSACIKLPNSGKILKLLILSSIREVYYGWNNSGKVIIQKILAKGMDNRGSKSVPNIINYTGTAIINNNVLGVVKEQRVDGSWFLNKQVATCRSLRCTLMGFERDYRIRILSKNLYKKGLPPQGGGFYSTSNNLNNETSINPWFLTGFIDGEGCFRISLTKVNREIGWRAQLFFQINLHKKDKALLENIKDYLAVGKIQNSGKNLIQYRIQTFEELTVLIEHLENYPLISKKRRTMSFLRRRIN